MTKYHIKDSGEPGVCKASIGTCPFGNELAHYTTPAKARNAFEQLMSKELWEPLNSFRFRDSLWEDLPWSVRKKTLERWLKALADKHGARLPKVEWLPSLDQYNTVAGKVIWSDEDFTQAESFQLAEFIEVLDEHTAREIVAHELAHIVTGKDHGDNDHGDEWLAVFKELIKDHPEIDPKPRTVLSDQELDRLDQRETANVSARWRGECAKGHIFFVRYKPAKSLCTRCLTVLSSRETITWEKWK